MVDMYIYRTLVADKGTPDARLIEEGEIASLSNPLVILGEPGIGKTFLTENLRITLGAIRVSAGTFSRSENLAPFAVPSGTPLIIDGLDEVSVTGSESPIDGVLRKLDRLGRPRFIISCRAADWQGSVDRWKILQDYGEHPLTLHLEPLSRDQALNFLTTYDAGINAQVLLDQIGEAGLDDLVGNPLTLGLLAKVALDGGGLPESRSALLEQATRMLVKEENPAHALSIPAQAPLDDLMQSAGAVLAHLLISGTAGVSVGKREDVPVGFVHSAKLKGMADAPLAQEVLCTRLFKSDGEGLFLPVHRVIAEYMGARWLGCRLQAGLSERRVFALLDFSGGVPTALRGLHAWLGHFVPAVADRCIKSDPYGVLRYAETDRLTTVRARLLLSSLTALAEEDPYFRSEDWGTRAVSGLARPELKAEILSVIRNPNRHIQLSSLIIEGLPGSALTKQMLPELLDLMRDSTSAYSERYHAVEALVASGTDIDWKVEVATLVRNASHGDKRLALDIIATLEGKGLSADDIANALIGMVGIEESGRDEDGIAGADYKLARGFSSKQCGEVLDSIAVRIGAIERTAHWRLNHQLASAVQRLGAKALLGMEVSPRRFWAWLRFVDSQSTYSSGAKDRISKHLREKPVFRRGIQRAAIEDGEASGSAWMTIVHDLPQANPGLAVSADDAAELLGELASREVLTDADVDLWVDLLRSLGRPDGLSESIVRVVNQSVSRHPRLNTVWADLKNPPPRDWELQEQRRQARYREKQAERFAEHRKEFGRVRAEIASGQELSALHSLALAYLDRYHDLESDTTPIERLRRWVGEELAEAATKGFVAVLFRSDLPTVERIAEVRNEGKHWTIEPIMTCGVAELVRTGRSLGDVPNDVLRAVLAIWWDMPEFNSSKLGDDVEMQLEKVVFCSSAATESFLVGVLEPAIKAGNEQVSALYRLGRDPRFSRIAEPLALRWLKSYPSAKQHVQRDLLHICLRQGAPVALVEVVHERLTEPTNLDPPSERMWTAVAFIVDLPEYRHYVCRRAESDRSLLWAVKDLISPERAEKRRVSLDVKQLEFIVSRFAKAWPVVGHPPSGWSGAENPWDATDFINSCIDEIGDVPKSQASDALERLSQSCGSYEGRVKHVRAQQRRLRRDREFMPPAFEQVKSILSGGTPGTVDDLKALVVDTLNEVQDYIRNGDTDSWEAFWGGDSPKVENICRDRLLDILRPRVALVVDLLPECLMPEKNRCDILALHEGKGVPIEVKGQWHSEVWDASKTQLDDRYGRDWRADGRGIYLVLWFGPFTDKRLTPNPDGLPAPTSSESFREMLLDRLGDSERGRIDVLVLDVSRPGSKTVEPRRRRRRKGASVAKS